MYLFKLPWDLSCAVFLQRLASMVSCSLAQQNSSTRWALDRRVEYGWAASRLFRWLHRLPVIHNFRSLEVTQAWQGHLENGNGRESRDCPESGIAFRRFKHSVRATPLFTINITSRLSLYTWIHSTTLWPSKRPPSAQDIHIPRSKHRYGGISSTNAIVVSPPSSPVLDANPPNMTVVLNDPSLWPLIYSYRMLSYFVGSWRTSQVFFCGVLLDLWL